MGLSARRSGRVTVIVASVLVLLAAVGVVAFRVFAPNETLSRPTVPYPEEQIISDARPYSELRAAPLVIENRIRVYAEKFRVWSDAPVGERYETTPYWAFRRWPAQVVGVASVATAAGPIVVTQWSDGDVIAIDARAGSIAWRANTPIATMAYAGRRTGASTVYAPPALRTTGPVVMALGQQVVDAYDAATGARLWEQPYDATCDPWTMPTLLVLPTCGPDGATATSVRFIGAGNGTDLGTWSPPGAGEPAGDRVVPALCDLGRSGCHLLTVASPASNPPASNPPASNPAASNPASTNPAATAVAAGVAADAWHVASDGDVTPIPSLEPGAVLSGSTVIYSTATGVAARPIDSTDVLWSWDGKATLLAADDAGVYLITEEDRTILGLSPATGALLSVGCASSQPNDAWHIGYIHPTDGPYLSLERVTYADPGVDDAAYYYGAQPVALVELYAPTKLPVWYGKFAACAQAATGP